MTKSPNPDEGLYHGVNLLAVLAHRKQNADHPSFPGTAYPTTEEEVNSVWAKMIDRGYVSLVQFPCLAVRITAEGEELLGSYVSPNDRGKRT